MPNYILLRIYYNYNYIFQYFPNEKTFSINILTFFYKFRIKLLQKTLIKNL